PVPGPTQAKQRMENNTDARTQLNIWGANGVKGNLLSLPYGGGMLYVQPIYLKSSGDRSYPQLQRVLLNFGDRTAFAENVQAGIAQLVGTGAPPVVQPPGNVPPTGNAALAAAAAKINQAIADLHAAQQKGDFEAYGKALAALEQALKEWQAAQ